MAYTSISSSLRAVGEPTSKQLFDLIHTNLEDINTRTVALEGATSGVAIFNEIVHLPDVTIGEQKVIYRTESDIQAGDDGLGSTWNLTDGTDVTGSDWDTIVGPTTLPDARGRYMRMQDNGASVDPDTGALRTTQADKTAVKGLSVTPVGNHSHPIAAKVSGPSGSNALAGIGPASPFGISTGGGGAHGHNLSGDNETRPVTMIANFFTKTDYNAFEMRRLFRVNAALTISTAEITTLIAGSSGTLEVDILKGSALSSMSSIFTTRPSVAQSSGNYTTSINQSITSGALVANDWVEMRIISLQSGQRNFHLNVSGS